ncbi:MAG: hypothetical protein NXI32_19985 [bacterium]|nr:hypothetical protein [bacterium]
MFWPGLIESKIPAFRDGYHFYYPQAVWLEDCWRAGELFPQWNRYEGLGSSAPGQTSTSLYYPLRAVFWLGFLSLPQRYALFVVAHLLLAAAGMGYAAKHLKIHTASSQLAMVSFALSCPVLFQQYNLIYLCSAAWIGFCLGALIDFVRHPQKFLPSLVVFILSTSMMILSGDPQTAVHTGIVALLFIIGAAFYPAERVRLVSLRIGWLTLATVCVAVLTVMQWLPAWRQSRLSNRLAAPEMVAAEDLLPEHHRLQEQLSKLSLGRMRRYEFSLSPWHLPTAIWPTLGGHFQKENSRWFQAIGSEGRMWIPSIYFGFLPCMFCLWGWFNIRRHRWLAWLALFALVASFGNYSPIWLCRELLLSMGATAWANALPADQSLSIYGFLSAVLPGYDSFRFPAKWTVWFTAATSLFAAVSMDGAQRRLAAARGPIGRVWSWSIAMLSVLLAALGLALLTPWPQTWLTSELGSDPWLGPLAPHAIAQSLCFSAFIVMTMLLLSIRYGATQRRLLVGLTMLEMFLVASCWSNFIAPPDLKSHAQLTTGKTTEDSTTAFVWSNAMRANLASDTTPSLPMMLRQAQLQDTFLIGKLAVMADLRNFASSQSIESAILEKLKLWLASQDGMQPEQPNVDELLAQLGVTHRLVASTTAEPREFFWKPVTGPRPLCELFYELGREPEEPSQTTWNWLSSSELLIEISPAVSHLESTDIANAVRSTAEKRLLIRQWNDGGWQAVALDDGRRQPLSINRAPTAFVEIELTPTSRRVLLTRKLLW